jgi:hypothetical protein
MDERREKGICFNCYNNYSKGHKCGKNKLFYIYYKKEEDKGLELSQDPILEDTYSNDIFSCIGRHQYSKIPQDTRIHQKEKGNSVD